ncbi:hypothetical protein ATO6_15270 [Oceanicola sp. 22II-s10i]|uniref:GNAT family N-acetyltransferase n=1 Tax=Oceanicola sp. 22II-s10i TaxID=1317116 RepID=UPI000B5260C3|nr:GNAT family N-acetyltransferase [Oceanicola sp. 22II-s10i]OWU83794.1 hypothetical protein ATO6_15270 [Oceanicola sp. 22II-s10i]
MFEVRIVKPEETLSVRKQVLWPNLPIDELRLAEDHSGVHFALVLREDEEERIVGVASFFPEGSDARLRKMAILPEVQGKGCGTHILEAAIAYLASIGVKRIWCDVRQSATGFYKSLGFVIGGDVFLKNGLEYLQAEKHVG